MISRVRFRQLCAAHIGTTAAAAFGYLYNDGFSFLRAASVMNEHLGAGLGERQGAGAPQPTRCAGPFS